MATFETTLQSCVRTLKELEASIRSISSLPDSGLPQSCVDHWGKIASLHKKMEESIPLLEIRDAAYTIMLGTTKPESRVKSDELSEHETKMIDPVHFGSCRISFATARYLSLSSYVSASWSLYDRLAVVAGKLIGPKGFANMPTDIRCPKLPTAFFDMKEKATDDMEESKTDKSTALPPRGFSLDCVISEKWRWPVLLSYKIRNYVLHDGIGKTDDAFFESNDQATGFCPTRKSLRRLMQDCYSTIGQQTPITEENISDQFPDRDLRIILKNLNTELDNLLERLLSWGTESFKKQIEIFTATDMGHLSGAKTTSTSH